MSARTTSAQFAAFVWFTAHAHNTGTTQADAMRFARKNWRTFLPLAHEGLGRLLLRLANAPVKPRCKKPRARVEVVDSCRSFEPLLPSAANERLFSCN
jgi:hypothetical protein